MTNGSVDSATSSPRIPTIGTSNTKATVGTVSIGNRIAGLMESISYLAPPLFSMLLSGSARHDFATASTCMGVALLTGGLFAKLFQRFQPSLASSSLRSFFPIAYMGVGAAMFGYSWKADADKKEEDFKYIYKLSELGVSPDRYMPESLQPYVEQSNDLVSELMDCPASLGLWEEVARERGSLSVLMKPEGVNIGDPKFGMILDNRNVFVIPAEHDDAKRKQLLVAHLCVAARHSSREAFVLNAEKGFFSKDDYFKTCVDLTLDECHCREQVITQCEGWGIPTPNCFVDGVDLNKLQQYFYDQWDVNYKTAFCELSPDHIDCMVAL